jgi:hypothetical protein
MIHVQESSIQSSPLARLYQAVKTLGAILRYSVKTRPGLWLGIAVLAVFGVAWAIVKLMFAAGGGTILVLLRNAPNQVGGAGLPGAAGAGGAGGPNPYNPKMQGPAIAPGFKFLNGGKDGKPLMYSDPSSDSPVVAHPPLGARLVYWEVSIQNGEIWYQTQIPGGVKGWVPGENTQDTRLEPLPETRRMQFIKRDVMVGGPSDTAGARG